MGMKTTTTEQAKFESAMKRAQKLVAAVASGDSAAAAKRVAVVDKLCELARMASWEGVGEDLVPDASYVARVDALHLAFVSAVETAAEAHRAALVAESVRLREQARARLLSMDSYELEIRACTSV